MQTTGMIALLSLSVLLTGVQTPDRTGPPNTSRQDQGRRSVTLPGADRQRALAGLPDIRTFQTKPTGRFPVDLNVVRTGHPYKGRRAQKPHTGSHIYFQLPERTLSAIRPQDFPAIYAV